MSKLMKHLRKHVAPILFIIVLLVFQAFADLSLPSYTSDIVNIGIQQSGISSPVPEVVRQSEMEKILAFVTESDQAVISDNYKLVEAGDADYTKKYPIVEEQAVYAADFKSDDSEDQLTQILGVPLLMVYGLESKSEMATAIRDQLAAQMPEQMLSAFMDEEGNLDVIKLFAALPQEQKAPILEQIQEQLVQMSEAIITQSNIAFVKAEYDAVGVDVSGLQNRYIITAGVKMLLLALLSMIVAILVSFIASRIAAAVSRDMRSQVFHKVISFSSAEYDKFSTASLITRSTNDVQQVQMMVVMLLRMILYAPILAIGGIIKVMGTNARMSWILAIGVGVLLIVVGTLFVAAMPKFKAMQKLMDRVNLVAREILSGLMVIRAFSTEEYEKKRFEKANSDLSKTNLFVGRLMSCMMPLMMLIMNLITLLIIWVGASHIDNGEMQVGDMMAFMQYGMMIIMSFLMLSMISIMLPRASVAAARIDEILTTAVSLKEPSQPKTFDTHKKGYVEFDHVIFTYPGAEEAVLHDLSFTAKPGETTAIIGSTGSGKSTVVNLIPRFFDISSGSIRVDGQDVREVDGKELRNRIGYVPQKGILFSGTIESNIKYSDPQMNDERMYVAARVAQAKEFIDSKSDKYDESISQGGMNVSGGQKQRLSIARAIAKEPEIYIFDDSFSALDYKTDVELRSALKAETADSTVIIVAQRISTILHADQILVLDEGKVVGRGTHRELLKNCDVYYQIASSQLSEAEIKRDLNNGVINSPEGGVANECE